MDKISEQDQLHVELLKTKVELARTVAQKAMLETTVASNEYRDLIKKIQEKYHLTENDAVQPDGSITRGVGQVQVTEKDFVNE